MARLKRRVLARNWHVSEKENYSRRACEIWRVYIHVARYFDLFLSDSFGEKKVSKNVRYNFLFSKLFTSCNAIFEINYSRGALRMNSAPFAAFEITIPCGLASKTWHF